MKRQKEKGQRSSPGDRFKFTKILHIYEAPAVAKSSTFTQERECTRELTAPAITAVVTSLTATQHLSL